MDDLEHYMEATSRLKAQTVIQAKRIKKLETALQKINSLKGGEGWDLLHCKRIATKALK